MKAKHLILPFALLAIVGLSSCSIKNDHVELERCLNSAYDDCLRIMESYSTVESVMNAGDFGWYCDLAGMSQSYGAACFMRANYIYNTYTYCVIEQASELVYKHNSYYSKELKEALSEAHSLTLSVHEWATIGKNTESIKRYNEVMDNAISCNAEALKAIKKAQDRMNDRLIVRLFVK